MYRSPSDLQSKLTTAIAAPLDPTAGQIIGTTNTFAIEKDGARLTIETDAGRAFVYLRGEGEAP